MEARRGRRNLSHDSLTDSPPQSGATLAQIAPISKGWIAPGCGLTAIAATVVCTQLRQEIDDEWR